MQGKLKTVGFVGLTLLTGAGLNIGGYALQGLLWERPAVEVKRVEADAATVAAKAEIEKARAEAAKAQAEAEKARAEMEKARAEMEKAFAAREASVAQLQLAQAERIKANAAADEVDFLHTVVNPHINDPLKRMGDLDNQIVFLEAKLEEPSLTTDARLKIHEEKLRAEKEIALHQRAMERKAQRLIGMGVGLVGYTVSTVKAQAGTFMPSSLLAQAHTSGAGGMGGAQ